MSDLALAVLLGGTLGAGLWSIVAALPRFAAPRLLSRVAPYVRDVTDPTGRTPRVRMGFDPASGLVGLARSGWANARRHLSRVLGGAGALSDRIARAGWRMSVDDFRGRQLAATLGGIAVGAVAAVGAYTSGRAGIAVLVVPIAAGVIGFVSVDAVLTRAIASRRARIDEELPTVLDFLALCLSAGESLPEAVRRTGDVGSGALAGELRRITHNVATGSPFVTALTESATRVGVPAYSRAVAQIVAATDRGAPIASVLRDQAADAHEEDRRRLLESAGKKEVAMLFPLVFLILPLSVLMAAFPGFVMLQRGFG